MHCKGGLLSRRGLLSGGGLLSSLYSNILIISILYVIFSDKRSISINHNDSVIFNTGSSSMILEFTTDGSVTHRGFRIEYKAIPEDTG